MHPDKKIMQVNNIKVLTNYISKLTMSLSSLLLKMDECTPLNIQCEGDNKNQLNACSEYLSACCIVSYCIQYA